MTESTSSNPVRWGILGTGKIAHKFANDLQKAAPDAVIVAVGSRSQETADAFGDEFGIPNRHASYEELAADPDVEVVYVSTPHPWHYEASLVCLNGGKHVLCEKAFTMNAREAKSLVTTAREKHLFLMEAMWTRFRPTMVKLRELVAAGELGELQYGTAAVGWQAPFEMKSRVYRKDLGGGILLDGTIYPISFLYMLFGSPSSVISTGLLGQAETDEQETIVFTYPNGAQATVFASLRTGLAGPAIVSGTKGRVEIAHQWWEPTELTLFRPGQEPETFSFPEPEGTRGYQYEAIAVGEAIRAGRLESDVMPLDESVEIMEAMDAMRAEWGLTYPADEN
ncbi:MAG: Gfo/Idh/MocA family oxidoreductase [Thermomicrobiales bacterium]